ncbi:MAG: 23S rRNA (adenine(2503)-C(2))-methyltransferase RlmN [Microthrixaceae bacterium]
MRGEAGTALYDLSRSELEDALSDEPAYRTDQVWDGLYRQSRPVEELSNVPRTLREHLAKHHHRSLRPSGEWITDEGDTVKFLWELSDGDTVETVLMNYPDQGGRTTVCVSTQAGCAMACSFCATGQGGFSRHLRTGEIVEQVLRAQRRNLELGVERPRISNVVFMGMGEPLANFGPTWNAVHRFHDDMGIGARHITISTVGLVPGIRRLADADLPVNLAVSLHAAHDALRDDLVPINRRWPLEELLRACEDYLEATHRRISFEWALIDSVNDTYEEADRLAALARRISAHVNLIPLNPTPGYAVRGSSRNRVHAFSRRLGEAGVNTTIRDTRGSDIDAACGQLRAAHDPAPVQTPRRHNSG